MLEVSVWTVRLATVAVFAVGAGFGWWLRPRLPWNEPEQPSASLEQRVLH